MAGVPPSFHQDVKAACLATGGVAYGRCAATLWRMRRFEGKDVEVVVERGHAPELAGVVVRRTDCLDRRDRTTIGNIPVTTRARTLLDLAVREPGRLEGALNGVLLANPTELGRIDRLLRRTDHRARGRKALRDLIDPFLAGRRPTESVLEDDFLALIRAHGLPEPVPQHEVGGYRLDFAYPELITGFELQSVLGHAEKADIQRNSEKATALLDWRIAYFTWADVHERAAYVAATVADLRRRRAA